MPSLMPTTNQQCASAMRVIGEIYASGNRNTSRGFQIVPFDPKHVSEIDVQPAQRLGLYDTQTPFGMAFTALMDGAPIAAAGVMEMWPGRGYAWALLGGNCGDHFLQIHRAVERGITTCGFRRVEMTLDAGFPEAVRWAELLGFVRETPEPMRFFFPNGRDALQFARIL